MKINYFALATAITIAFTSTTYGGILDGALTFNGIRDELKDESVGSIVDSDGSGTVNAGDYIQGVIQIDQITRDAGSSTVSVNSVFAVYSLKVSSVVGTVINLTSETDANNNYSISKILTESGFSTAGLTNVTGALSNAVFAVFEKSGTTSLTDIDADTTDSTPISVTYAGDDRIGNVIAADQGWTLDLVAGLLGDDVYQINLRSASYLNLATLAALYGNPGNTTIGDYYVASSVLYHSFGAGTVFLELVTADADNNTVYGDIVAAGNNIISEPSDAAHSGNWNFSDDGNFKINATPEPMSLAVWSVLGTIGMVGLRRRRNSK